jgi:protein O-mannosyl-transferase
MDTVMQIPNQTHPNSRITGRYWLVCMGLVAATLLAYQAVGGFSFVNYDDWAYVESNPQVRRGLTWDGLAWAFGTVAYSNWHPVTWLSHMLDVELFGVDAGAHHLSNLVLHILNSLLLFGILHRITGALWKSAVVAALFALHPLHVESVAWVSERKDLLSALFFMLTIRWYVLWVERPAPLRYAAVAMFFALGLMAKPMVVTLPFVLLILDFWPLGRMGPAGGGREKARAWASLAVEKTPLLVLSALSCAVTYQAQNLGGSISRLDVLPFYLRAANAVLAYTAYMGKMIWPRHLAVLYPIPEPLPWLKTALSFLLLLALFIFAFRQMRQRPWLTAGWLWYAGMLVPVIGLVQVGSQAMADRYTYLPLIGLFVIVAWGMDDICRAVPGKQRLLAVASVSVIFAMSVSTFWQVKHWRDSVALFGHAIAVTRNNHVAHFNMACALKDRGRLAEAEMHYMKTLALNPDQPGAHNNLGVALAGQGRIEDAGAHWRLAMAMAPDDPKAFDNYGLMLIRDGRIEEGMTYLARALAVDPDFSPAHANMGMAMLCRGEIGNAIGSLTKAVELTPHDINARKQLAMAKTLKSKILGAVQGLETILEKAPRGNAGMLGAKRKALAGAISDYQRAVSRLPGFAAEDFNPAALPAVGRVLAEWTRIERMHDVQ